MALILMTRGSVTGEFFEDNEGGVDEKALLHVKRWGLYLYEKDKLVEI